MSENDATAEIVSGLGLALSKLEPVAALIGAIVLVLAIRFPAIISAFGKYRNERRSINLKHQQAMQRLQNTKSKAKSSTQKS